MDSKGILIIIAVILLGIFTVLIIQANDESPAEKISDSVSETVEEVGDEVEETTDGN